MLIICRRAILFLTVIGFLLVENTIFAAFTISPAINTNNIINVINFGAVGDGITTNTTAIQNAINSASAGGTTNGLSGGTVEIPAAAGAYLCGPISLKTKVNLQVDGEATLKMLSISNWPGATTFINGSSIHDVEISGAGIIDGNAHFGSNDWWGTVSGNVDPVDSRPNFINFSSSSNILIQDITLQNPPTFHIMIKNNNANITVQNITMNTPGNSPNTDGFDIASTNVVIQNSFISVGDDHVEIGGSQRAVDILVTNCTFGTGHGVSVGSITSGGVSNITTINCTFNGADNGIRLKSDNKSSGGGAGGLCQNINYFNIGMTNIVKLPIAIYSYYEEVGTPNNITPQTAATEPIPSPIPGTTVKWRNVVISNVTVTVAPGVIAGIIWGRTEMPVTNILFSHVNISASKSFDIYNAKGVQFVDSQITLPGSASTFTLFNAQLTITNSTPSANGVTLDGLTTNGFGNVLSIYNAQASLKNTNVFDDGPLTISSSTLTISNNLTLFPSTVLNYALGTNAATVAVVGNLTLGGTNNLSAGAGFTNGIYTLLTYTGTLSGAVPTLGSVPAGYNYLLDDRAAGQVKLIVTQPAPPAPTNLVASGTNLLINLKWNSVSGAATYNLKRGTVNNGPYPTIVGGLTTTNYADADVTNAVNYFYIVTAVNGGESANSLQASAVPLPSNQPTNIILQAVGGELKLSWPQDHLGWHLQIQTNNLSNGLGTNWTDVPNANATNQVFIPINSANGSVFLRLISP